MASCNASDVAVWARGCGRPSIRKRIQNGSARLRCPMGPGRRVRLDHGPWRHGVAAMAVTERLLTPAANLQTTAGLERPDASRFMFVLLEFWFLCREPFCVCVAPNINQLCTENKKPDADGK